MAPAKNRMGNVGVDPHFEKFSAWVRLYAGIIDAPNLSTPNGRVLTAR